MNSDYSYDALVKFADYAGDKGLAKPATASAWKTAAQKVFEDLSPPELQDVRGVDLETAFAKFVNKSGRKFSPASLGQYRSRISTLVKEFVKYKESPHSYRPRSSSSAKKLAQTRLNTSSAKASASTGSDTVRLVETGSSNTRGAIASTTGRAEGAQSAGAGLTMAYPLRQNFLAQIVLPRDLTTDEAKRLAAFIATLAHDFTP